MSQTNGHKTIWGQRKEVTCPSGQVAKLRMFSMIDMVMRGVIPLGLLDAPVKIDSVEEPTAEDNKKQFDLMRVVVQAGVAEPKIGEGDGYVSWDEIPQADRTFLFNQISEWLKLAGGLAAVTADVSFPNRERSPTS